MPSLAWFVVGGSAIRGSGVSPVDEDDIVFTGGTPEPRVAET